jgi:hypothetical protein
MTASTSTVRPMATDKQQFLVFTNPVEGREDEYNEWYDNVHLGDVATDRRPLTATSPCTTSRATRVPRSAS